MASAAERFHIVLAPEERQRWNANAALHGVSTGEYVRRAVSAFDDAMTPEQIEQLSVLADEAGEAAKRIKLLVDDIDRICRAPLDDEDMRRRVAIRLAEDPVEIDPAILDFATDDIITTVAA